MMIEIAKFLFHQKQIQPGPAGPLAQLATANQQGKIKIKIIWYHMVVRFSTR